MMYSKLFSSLVHSSLWSEPDHIRLLFITLLAIADRDGIVYGSRAGIERAAMIDPDAAEEMNPWTALMSPDNDSSDLMRNPDNEGRRVEEIPGGFRIINYTYYRSLRDAEDRKAQNREAQQRHREKISPSKPPSATVSHRNPIESKSEIKTEKKKEAASVKRMPTGKNGLVDSEWIASLKADKTYAGVDVDRELGKMHQWCKIRQLTPSRRRFINWLNRAEKPMTTKNGRDPDELMSDKLWQLKHGNS